VLLAGLAPIVWLATDWALAGDPLHSLTHTQEGARVLERTVGLANTPDAAKDGLVSLLTGPVLLGGGIGFLLAARDRRAWPMLALGVLGGAIYLAVGVAELSLLDRYLAISAVTLALTFGHATVGWAGERARGRAVWAVAGALLAGYAAIAIPGRVDELRAARSQVAATRRSSATCPASTPVTWPAVGPCW
jgi:hypothetical protein